MPSLALGDMNSQDHAQENPSTARQNHLSHLASKIESPTKVSLYLSMHKEDFGNVS